MSVIIPQGQVVLMNYDWLTDSIEVDINDDIYKDDDYVCLSTTIPYGLLEDWFACHRSEIDLVMIERFLNKTKEEHVWKIKHA